MHLCWLLKLNNTFEGEPWNSKTHPDYAPSILCWTTDCPETQRATQSLKRSDDQLSFVFFVFFSFYIFLVAVLVEYVPTFSPGLNFPRTHCYSTHQCTAAMPFVVKLLLLGEGIVGKVYKRKRTDRDRKTDRQLLLLPPSISCLWPMPLICFFDGTKSEMIVINCLPYQLTQM